MADQIQTDERTNLVTEYLSKYRDMPTLTLSKLIMKNHPEFFTSIEACRSRLRYYRGSNGEFHRRGLSTDEFLGDGPGVCDPFERMPEGLKHFDEWEPYKINGEKVLRLSDVHIPYHDKSALMCALKWGRSENIDTIVIDDWIDFFSISFWDKDPRKRNFKNELNTSKKILGIVRELFPDSEMIWCKGNHEARYDRYMTVKAPELLDVDEYQFDNVTGARQLGIKIIDDKMFCQMGKLNIVHGHEFGRSIFSPVNPARGLYLRAKTNCIAGHWHQTSNHTEKDLNDKVVGCWTVGCLCDMRPDYSPINKWNHGAAIIYRTGTKTFKVINKTIINGELY